MSAGEVGPPGSITLRTTTLKALDQGYTVEVDRQDKATWHRLIRHFDDASFYQTWSYGGIAWGAKNLSHLVVRYQGKAVAAAQLRIAKCPLGRTGFAYTTYSPLWRERTEAEHQEGHLRNVVRALHNEYVIRRGYYLRIIPRVLKPCAETMQGIFMEESFLQGKDPMNSVVLDLS